MRFNSPFNNDTSPDSNCRDSDIRESTTSLPDHFGSLPFTSSNPEPETNPVDDAGHEKEEDSDEHHLETLPHVVLLVQRQRCSTDHERRGFEEACPDEGIGRRPVAQYNEDDREYRVRD
jgi:hypothetical protein